MLLDRFQALSQETQFVIVFLGSILGAVIASLVVEWWRRWWRSL
jgi:hypothetical protein